MYHLNWQVDWDAGGDFIRGLGLALEMAVIAMIAGSVIGIFGALLRTSKVRPLQWLVRSYVELFRNIPLLLLIFFIYFGLPTSFGQFADARTSMIIALSVFYGAYLSEVFRAGIQAVSTRYLEGAKALGLQREQIIRYITLPIMFRVVLPSLGNTLISLFKDTSLASAIAVAEITYVGEQIQTNTFRTVEAWTAVALLYLTTSYLLAFLLRLAERRFALWTE
jgi:polar amino acid transport system permease protein